MLPGYNKIIEYGGIMVKELKLDFEYQEIGTTPKKFQKFFDLANKFFYSYWYLAFMVVLIALSWRLAIPEIAFIPAMALLTFILIFLDDAMPVIPTFFMLTSVFPKGASIEKYAYLLYFSIPFLIALVYHIFKYKRKWKLGKLFFPQLAIAIALLMGGLGSNITASTYSNGLTTGLLLGFGVLAFYFIFNNYINTGKCDIKLYFSKSMTAVGMLLVLEMIMFMFFNPEMQFSEIKHDFINLGSQLSNGVAMTLLLTAPFSFYLALKQPKLSFIHFVCALAQYLALFLTYSRGGILFAVVTMPIALIYTVCKTKDYKWKFIMDYIILMLGLLVVYFCFMEQINDVLYSILHARESIDIDSISSGRISLYKEAFGVFSQFPAFGASLGYTSSNRVDSVIKFFWFHSTFFQIIACTGIFGLLMFIYGYYGRFKIIFTNIKKSSFNFIALVAFIGFEGYSMIDCGTFIPMPFMLMVTIITLIVEKANEQEKLKVEEQEFREKQIV